MTKSTITFTKTIDKIIYQIQLIDLHKINPNEMECGYTLQWEDQYKVEHNVSGSTIINLCADVQTLSQIPLYFQIGFLILDKELNK